jgi:hypothetical protein
MARWAGGGTTTSRRSLTADLLVMVRFGRYVHAMSLVEKLVALWEPLGLASSERWIPTFIEDVGTASAENMRSAALRRWMHNQPSSAATWLGEVTGLEIRSTSLQVEREVAIRADSRVDLRVSDGSATVFIEVKWGAAPDDAQLMRYHDVISARFPSAVLVILSPVRHVPGQGCALPGAIRRLDWRHLADALEQHDLGGTGSIEADLQRTLSRWRCLTRVVHDAARAGHTTVKDLRELVQWVDDRASAAGMTDYPALARELVLSELAEAYASRDPAWRRCLTNRGANGDFQADVCQPEKGDSWQACPSYAPHGVASVLRFRAYPEMDTIDVQVGSAVTPYLTGADRRAWMTSDPKRAKGVFEHASSVRASLYDAVRCAGLRPTGSTDTTQWWKRAYSASFGERATVRELLEHASQVGACLP